MKFIQKYLVILFFIYWIGYIALRLMFSRTPINDHVFFNVAYLGLIMAALFAGAVGGGLYFSVGQRVRYIESRDLKVPYYADRQEKFITPTKNDFSFSELQSKINQNWILTYVDTELNVIKFRTQDSLFDWGVGSYVEYDTSVNTVSVVSFPFAGYTQKGRRLKTELNNQVEALVMNA